jgi:hypothetical protein
MRSLRPFYFGDLTQKEDFNMNSGISSELTPTISDDVSDSRGDLDIRPEVAGLWTVKDAAVFLRKSVRWVFYALRKPENVVGSLPNVKLGRTPRFVPDDLRAWVGMGCPPAGTFKSWKDSGSRKRRMS